MSDDGGDGSFVTSTSASEDTGAASDERTDLMGLVGFCAFTGLPIMAAIILLYFGFIAYKDILAPIAIGAAVIGFAYMLAVACRNSRREHLKYEAMLKAEAQNTPLSTSTGKGNTAS